MCSASHPPVETAYPLTRKVSPLPWRWRSPNCRATAIADVPLRELTTSATASFPGLPAFTTLNLKAKPREAPWSNQGLTCQRVTPRDTVGLGRHLYRQIGAK